MKNAVAYTAAFQLVITIYNNTDDSNTTCENSAIATMATIDRSIDHDLRFETAAARMTPPKDHGT
jgi:hypothetical protein